MTLEVERHSLTRCVAGLAAALGLGLGGCVSNLRRGSLVASDAAREHAAGAV